MMQIKATVSLHWVRWEAVSLTRSCRVVEKTQRTSLVSPPQCSCSHRAPHLSIIATVMISVWAPLLRSIYITLRWYLRDIYVTFTWQWAIEVTFTNLLICPWLGLTQAALTLLHNVCHSLCFLRLAQELVDEPQGLDTSYTSRVPQLCSSKERSAGYLRRD